METPAATGAIGDWVLYKNNQLIAFNKPPALPTQPDKGEEKSLLDLGEIYTKSKLYLIHRLDRPAGGIVLFAKNKNALAHLNQQFSKRSVRKQYLAVVQAAPPAETGTLQHWLVKKPGQNKTTLSEVFQENATEAILKYQLLGKSDRYFLLSVELVTGRHHQIRAQLAAIGCCIKGDVKYGARRSNPDRSIHLHAWQLEFQHPVSGEQVTLVAPPPATDPVWAAFSQQGFF